MAVVDLYEWNIEFWLMDSTWVCVTLCLEISNGEVFNWSPNQVRSWTEKIDGWASTYAIPSVEPHRLAYDIYSKLRSLALPVSEVDVLRGRTMVAFRREGA